LGANTVRIRPTGHEPQPTATSTPDCLRIRLFDAPAGPTNRLAGASEMSRIRSDRRDSEMTRHPRRRFWLEIIAATVSAVLLVVTLLWKEWIEIAFRVDPDQGSGALEWLIVAVSAAVAVALLAGAGYEWRRAARRAS
jgi:uncharacterized membrane protein YcjF (UPF0283 family)